MANRVVDSDAHVLEGRELMGELMTRFPDKIRPSREDEWGAALVIEGRLYPHAFGPGAGCPAKEGMCLDRGANPFTADGVVRDADREGIDAMVFFPSAALGLPGFEDQAFAAEFARLYNRWLAGYCRQHPARLFGVGLVPIEDVPASIAIMREAKELGLVAIMVPAVLKTRNLDHADLEPFYAAAEELDMPLGVHGAPGIHLPKLGSERFDNYLQVHVVSFPFDMMVATTALVLGGVLERHPQLRVALLESGVGWVPYLVDRMDEHVEKRGRLAPACRRKPREYVARGQLYVSCEPEESTLPFVAEALGSDFIMYASDYPHWDSDFPESTKPLRERTDLPPEVKARVLGENAARFYRLPA
jgi:predicted TIM-barrel fold metal-dependent hydrolase